VVVGAAPEAAAPSVASSKELLALRIAGGEVGIGGVLVLLLLPPPPLGDARSAMDGGG